MFLVLAKKTSQLKAKRRKLLSTSTKGGGRKISQGMKLPLLHECYIRLPCDWLYSSCIYFHALQIVYCIVKMECM